ncbi:hypothetical protein ACIHFC_29780 [Streptomyces sp. NPDC052013]
MDRVEWAAIPPLALDEADVDWLTAAGRDAASLLACVFGPGEHRYSGYR